MTYLPFVDFGHSFEDLVHVIADLIHRNRLVLCLVLLNDVLQVGTAVFKHHVLHCLVVFGLAVVDVVQLDDIQTVLKLIKYLKFA